MALELTEDEKFPKPDPDEFLEETEGDIEPSGPPSSEEEEDLGIVPDGVGDEEDDEDEDEDE